MGGKYIAIEDILSLTLAPQVSYSPEVLTISCKARIYPGRRRRKICCSGSRKGRGGR